MGMIWCLYTGCHVFVCGVVFVFVSDVVLVHGVMLVFVHGVMLVLAAGNVSRIPAPRMALYRSTSLHADGAISSSPPPAWDSTASTHNPGTDCAACQYYVTFIMLAFFIVSYLHLVLCSI